MGCLPGRSPPRHTVVVKSLGNLSHLVARFFTSLSPAPPSVEDEVWADAHFLPGERALWARLGNRDRRHSVRVARRFVVARPGASRAEIAGALLHDVGKVDCGLGTFGRVAATVIGPRGERFSAYHDHEAIGAAMVAQVGSDAATVELVAEQGPAYPDLSNSDRA